MCCGKKRSEVDQISQANPPPKPEVKNPEPSQLESDRLIYFQYQGATGLTVLGPASHKRYRFDSPGAIVVVDAEDKRALAGVSSLRQVRKGSNGA